MSELELVKNLYKTGELKSAAQQIDAIELQQCASEDLVEMLKIIYQLEEISDWKIAPAKEELILFLLTEKADLKNIDYITRKIEARKKTRNLIAVYKIISGLGRIDRAISIFNQISVELLGCKEYATLKMLAEYGLERLGKQDVFYIALMKCAVETGDYETLLNNHLKLQLDHLRPDNLSKIPEYLTFFCILYSEQEKERRLYTEKKVGLKKLFVYSAIKYFKREDKNAIGSLKKIRKNFISYLYDLLLFSKDYDQYLLLCLMYSIIFSRKKMGQTIELYFDMTKMRTAKSAKWASLFRNEVDHLPEDNDRKLGELDLGQDLFQEDENIHKMFRKVKEFERNIKALVNSHDYSSADKLIAELLKIDPENKVALGLKGKTHKKMTKSKELDKETDLVKLTLLNEKPSSEEEQELYLMRRQALKALELKSDRELVLEFHDIMVSLFFMEQWDLILDFLSMLRNKKIGAEDEITAYEFRAIYLRSEKSRRVIGNNVQIK